MRNPSARRTLAVTLLALAPLAAQAAGTSVRFDDEASPFPSNRLSLTEDITSMGTESE